MTKITTASEKLVSQDKEIYPAFARIPYYPLAIRRGYGSTIEDMDGNKFIDLLASASALNTGHCHPRVVEAITQQASELIHYTAAYTYSQPMVELSKQLIRITPGDYKKKVAFGLTGSDANDGMIKLARAYTGRSKIVTFIGSYHGSTYGALSMSALSLNMRRKIGPLLPEMAHIPYPNCYRCRMNLTEDTCSLECMEDFRIALENYMPPEEIAAVVLEPIAGDAGLIVPPKRYVKELHRICQEYGILFVSEEVQQGYGRTGKWFGIEHFDVEPDMVVLGKSMASGMPLSAIVGRKEIMDSLDAPAHLFTMGGNPVSCQAGIATIDIIEDENLIERSRKMGDYVQEQFKKMQQKYPLIGDVRGKGLSIGIELVKDPVTKEKDFEGAAKICYRCCEKGVLLIFIANNVLRFQPPLVITQEEIDQALSVIEESMEEYLQGEISDEVLQVAKGW